MCPNCGGDWNPDLANAARMNLPYLEPGESVGYHLWCPDCRCTIISTMSGVAGLTEVYDLNDPEVRAKLEAELQREFPHLAHDDLHDASSFC